MTSSFQDGDHDVRPRCCCSYATASAAGCPLVRRARVTSLVHCIRYGSPRESDIVLMLLRSAKININCDEGNFWATAKFFWQQPAVPCCASESTWIYGAIWILFWFDLIWKKLYTVLRWILYVYTVPCRPTVQYTIIKWDIQWLCKVNSLKFHK